VKVIVCGSRSFTGYWVIYRRLQKLPAGSVIVHGASPGGGADQLADRAARLLGHTVIPVPIDDGDRARAGGYPKRAPIFRNLRMLDEHPDAEVVLAYWDGESPGTGQMVGEARRRGLTLELCSPQLELV
jgi:hypothetical protein